MAGVRMRGGGLLVLQAGQLCLRLGDPGLVERRILRTVRAEVDGGPSRRGTVMFFTNIPTLAVIRGARRSAGV